MATSQKKPGGKRVSRSGGRRQVSTGATQRTSAPQRKTASGAPKSKSAPSKPQTAKTEARPFRREIGAGICFVLAIFTLMGCFHVKALFIDFFCQGLRGLLGYGFWCVPPAFLFAAYIFTAHRGSPVQPRLVCLALIPLAFAGLLHGLLSELLPWDVELFGQLWNTGLETKSGGVLSGLFAQCFVSLFSRLGCTIIFAMMLIILGLAACDRTLFDAADWVFNRPHDDTAPSRPRSAKTSQERSRPDGRETAAQRITETPQKSRAREPRVMYDIPVDDEIPDEQPEQSETRNMEFWAQRDARFFDPVSRVPTPEQFLGDFREEKNIPYSSEPEPFIPMQVESVPEPELRPDPVPAPPVEPGLPFCFEKENIAAAPDVVREPTFIPKPVMESGYLAGSVLEMEYQPSSLSGANWKQSPETELKWDPAPFVQDTGVPTLEPVPMAVEEAVEKPIVEPVPTISEDKPEPMGQEPMQPVSSTTSWIPSAPLSQPVSVSVPVATASMPVSAPEVEKSMPRQEPQNVAAEAASGVPSYSYPPLSLLNPGTGDMSGDVMRELNANRKRLSDAIHSFGIDAHIVNVTRGPSVTRYELELDQGVRLSKLTNLSEDIALALGASGVRIAPIPDQISIVGIEVPNKVVAPVNIHSVISSKAFQESASKVSFAVGKDIGGNAIVGNIAKMPHMLIAGTTGSGKSVCTNSLIISLLYKSTPEEVRLIMVDPKMVELGIYNGIPHLLIPVVTDPKKAAGALQWAVYEMMKRYKAFSELGVRDLASYNVRAAGAEGLEKMPQIVIIIDELADLMMVAAKEVEESICRVAQMGRAAGMHLIIATQRPSADVITGLMKANIPSRIAFAVASNLESRIILDAVGAEKLIGRGDMLYSPIGDRKPTRVQGCLITDPEVAAVVDFIKKSGGVAQYDDEVMHEIERQVAEKEKGAKGNPNLNSEDGGGDYDELIDDAAEVVVETGQASASMLQRRLKLGYARAARLIDQLEEKGIVGPFEGSKPRQLLITKEQWQEMKYRRGTVLTRTVERPTRESEISSSVPDTVLDRTQEDTL